MGYPEGPIARQEVLDVRARDNQAEVPDPEAYANVGASISLPNLAVGAASNVGAATRLAIRLGQTTQHTPISEIHVGRAPGNDSAPVASKLPPPPPLTCVQLSEYMQRRVSEDLSLAPNVGPASTTSSVGRLPQSAIESEMAHPSCLSLSASTDVRYPSQRLAV